MHIIHRRRLVQDKIERIRDGYSAYAETIEIANLVKRELEALNLTVHEDVTEHGSWFIPENRSG